MLNSEYWKQKVHQDNLIRPYPGHRLYAVCYEAHDVVKKWLAFLQQAPLSHVCCIIATSSPPIHPSWGFYNYSINSLQQTLQSCTLGRIMKWCHIQKHERGWSSMNQECRIDQSGATKSPVWGYGTRQHQWKTAIDIDHPMDDSKSNFNELAEELQVITMTRTNVYCITMNSWPIIHDWN